MTHYYRLDEDKLQAIIAKVREWQPVSVPPHYVNRPEVRATDAQIEDHLLYDWPEGQEHQDWLDNAPVEEIANWVINTYEPDA